MKSYQAILGTMLIALLQACGGGSNTSAAIDGASGQSGIAAAPPLNKTGKDDDVGTLALGASLIRTRHAGGAGMNLTEFASSSTDAPTIDVIKRMQPWVTSTLDPDWVWDTHEEAQLDLDANGWVKSLPLPPKGKSVTNYPKYRAVSTVLNDSHSVKSMPAGDYHVFYEGDGDVSFFGELTQKTVEPGHIVLTRNPKDGENFGMRITRINPDNYLRNIRVIMPGGICTGKPLQWVAGPDACPAGGYTSLVDLSRTQIWSPNFLADLNGVRALRFMDWFRINDSTLSNWSQRPAKSDATWSGSGGVPVGVAINLANTLSADAWMNIPYHADNDYVQRMAQLARTSLNPAAKFIVEYGNEPWNTAWPFVLNYKWLAEQGLTRFHRDGKPDASEYDRAINFYALRSNEICQIAKKEFGDQSSRVQCALNTQFGWPDQAKITLACALAVETGKIAKDCSGPIDAVAVGAYVGGYLGEPGENGKPGNVDKVASWGTGSAGVDKVFEELLGKNVAGQDVDTPLQVPYALKGAVAHAGDLIRQYKTNMASGPYKKPLFAYEGGQHLRVVAGSPYPDATSLFISANRDKRMGDVYNALMAEWIKVEGIGPGQVFVHFNNVSSYSEYGSWGLREAAFADGTSSPKWMAFKPFRETTACWWDKCSQ